MQLSLASVFLRLLFIFRLTIALGINCRGSSKCGVALFLPPGRTFVGEAALGCHIGIDVHRFYLPGEQVACVKAQSGGGICLFIQGKVPPKGIEGAEICPLLEELVKHGCANCGSIPLSGDNDPEKRGILTANYVVRPSCLGWCRSLN